MAHFDPDGGVPNAGAPAGWYTDPFGAAGELRWWDGSQWTGRTLETAEPAVEAEGAVADDDVPNFRRRTRGGGFGIISAGSGDVHSTPPAPPTVVPEPHSAPAAPLQSAPAPAPSEDPVPFEPQVTGFPTYGSEQPPTSPASPAPGSPVGGPEAGFIQGEVVLRFYLNLGPRAAVTDVSAGLDAIVTLVTLGAVAARVVSRGIGSWPLDQYSENGSRFVQEIVRAEFMNVRRELRLFAVRYQNPLDGAFIGDAIENGATGVAELVRTFGTLGLDRAEKKEIIEGLKRRRMLAEFDGMDVDERAIDWALKDASLTERIQDVNYDLFNKAADVVERSQRLAEIGAIPQPLTLIEAVALLRADPSSRNAIERVQQPGSEFAVEIGEIQSR